MLNVLIPMAGKDVFNVSDSNGSPRLLTDVDGKLLIEHSSKPFVSLSCDKKIIVAISKEQIEAYELDKVFALIDSSIELSPINGHTKGAVCSALLAVDHLELDQPLIVSSFEQVIDVDLSIYIDKFKKQDADAGVLTFEAIHPKWSYVRLDEAGLVSQAAEKSPISKNAIAGLYYFKRAQMFIDAAKNMIRNDAVHNGLYYLSHTLNEVILKEGKVVALPINVSQYCHIHDEHTLLNYQEQSSRVSSRPDDVLYKRTRAYIDAFDSRSIHAVSGFFSDNFELIDPSVHIVGKDLALDYILNLFTQNQDLEFRSENIIINGRFSVIEFELLLNDVFLVGVDIIHWDQENKMTSMNAYLYERD